MWNLAKVMLIKDEPYVAYLLTRYEKRQRDLAKYAVDVSNGDRLVYRHHTSPEFNVGPYRLRLQDHHQRLAAGPGQAHEVVAERCRVGTPARSAFREWYVSLLDRVSLNDANYGASVEVLKCAEAGDGVPRGAVPEDGRGQGRRPRRR